MNKQIGYFEYIERQEKIKILIKLNYPYDVSNFILRAQLIYNTRVNDNILVVQQNNFGGEQIAVRRLFEAYKKNSPNSACIYKLLEPFRESNIRFSFLPKLLDYFITSRLEIANLLKNNNYDFFITSDYLLALVFYSLRIKDMKMIFMFHGLRSVIFKKINDINFRQLTIKLLEKLAMVLSDAVIVPSEESKIFLGLNKAYVVQNIVPEKYFIKKPMNKNKYFNILYSGRIVKNKGLKNLTECIKKLRNKIPNIKLTIAYPSSGIDKQVYSSLSIPRDGTVRMVCNQTESNLIELYSNSDLLVLPSELEFAPLSVLESMACGTPVISTKVGNVENLLNIIDKNLLLKDNSQSTIYERILNYYNYSDKLKSDLRIKSRQLAMNFTSSKSVKNFITVLDNI